MQEISFPGRILRLGEMLTETTKSWKAIQTNIQVSRLLAVVSVNKLYLSSSFGRLRNQTKRLTSILSSRAGRGRATAGPRPGASFQRRSRIAKGYHKRNDWCESQSKLTNQPTKVDWKHLL